MFRIQASSDKTVRLSSLLNKKQNNNETIYNERSYKQKTETGSNKPIIRQSNENRYSSLDKKNFEINNNNLNFR